MKVVITIVLLAALALSYELGRLMGEQQSAQQRTQRMVEQYETPEKPLRLRDF